MYVCMYVCLSILTVFIMLFGSNLQSTFRFNNFLTPRISLYVSETTVNIDQTLILTRPQHVKGREHFTTTTTCIQIDVYSTCIHTYIHTNLSPVALYTPLNFDTNSAQISLNIPAHHK